MPDDFFVSITHLAYERLNLLLAHLECYRSLPLLHRDPFDRLLIAQSQVERLTLITRDPEVLAYPDVDCLRA